MMKTKVCTKCGTEYPATTEFWHKQKDGKYGLKPTCKGCVSEYTSQYYQENSDRIRQYQRDNMDKVREYRRRHYIKYRDRYLEYSRQRALESRKSKNKCGE